MIFILLQKTINIKWNKGMKQYYINKGYEFTEFGKEFEIDIKDLPLGSHSKVLVRCDYCGEKYMVMYQAYNRQHERLPKDACRYCCQKKAKESLMTKYNVSNPSQIPGVSDKVRNTFIEKYGVANIALLDSTKEKVKETNIRKFGTDSYTKTEEYQHRVKNTSLEKYGVEHFTQNKDVIAKRKFTNIERYGVEFPIQNKEILQKSIDSRYQHGTFTCSKQQYQLHQSIGGELNYPFENFVIDVAFPDERIAVEWDGSGHDLSVRLGKLTPEQFARNENYRNIVLFQKDWKIIRFISQSDVFPSNISKIFSYCISYIHNGGHYIIVHIDNNQIQYKNTFINIDEI